jgi:hypothetical protein
MYIYVEVQIKLYLQLGYFRTGFEPGTDIMISNILLPKNLAKQLAFRTQITASLCKN